jgi:enoyl-CoA hydratase/3-hydroxyacyl-CoA dehydrogenase
MTHTLRNPLLVRPVRGPPRRIVVVGAGTIGPDIGYYFKSSLPGLELVLLDVAEPALERAKARLEGYVEKGIARGKLTSAQVEALQSGITYTTDYDSIAGADWVLEAATENLDLKRRIFAQAAAIAPPHALLTSNTSSIPAAHIFSGLQRPERATVTHFFAPAHRNPIVEVIDWPTLNRELLAYLRWVFARTGKVPLTTRDVVCFMLDRIFDNWCNEAGHLLETASPAEIDSVAQEFVAAGPFFVLNLANGNPIIVETNTLQAAQEGDHYMPVDAFRSQDPWQTVKPGEQVPVPAARAAAIRDRLLGILLSQSLDILDRKIGTPEDLELGARLAFGFKRGPLEYLRALPDPELARIGQRLVDERPGLPFPLQAASEARTMRRFVVHDDIDGVIVLTIRRPEALNALHDEINEELLAVIRRHADDQSVRGFVITGYGARAFSAGADIGRFPEVLGDTEAAIQYARDCSRLLEYLDRMRKPVVAALNGMALGGGLELAMRCQGIVATKAAWMQFPEITLGLLPGIGGMVVPFRRWPHAARTFHGMLREAHKLDAAAARELGILDAVVDDVEDLLPAALRLIDGLARTSRKISESPVEVEAGAPVTDLVRGKPVSRQVISLIERAVSEAAKAPTLAAALEIGYRAFGKCACTAAAREGVTAFGERRPPDFSATG